MLFVPPKVGGKLAGLRAGKGYMMAPKKQDRLDRIEASITSLASLVHRIALSPSHEDVGASVQVADTAPATGTTTKLPASAALNTLQGQCKPAAARMVERNVNPDKGIPHAQGYVAKLRGFQSGDRMSPRCAYAVGRLDAMQSGQPTTPATKVGLRRPRNTDAITPKRNGNGGSAVATVKQPKPGASGADWLAYVKAADGGQSSIGAAAWRSRAGRAKETANGRDPYRSAA